MLTKRIRSIFLSRFVLIFTSFLASTIIGQTPKGASHLMEQILVDHEELTINYKEGFGAWTYYLRIPGTKDLPGKWGQMKVSGYIDDYKLENHNLAPRTDEDKIISLNQEIRHYIHKSAGDTVTVTLYLNSDYLYEYYGY